MGHKAGQEGEPLGCVGGGLGGLGFAEGESGPGWRALRQGMGGSWQGGAAAQLATEQRGSRQQRRPSFCLARHAQRDLPGFCGGAGAWRGSAAS